MMPQDDHYWRLSIEQYHQMLDADIIDADTPVELLDGLLVQKLRKSPRHSVATQAAGRWLDHKLSESYFAHRHAPVTLESSEPEPDVSVIRGRPDDFAKRHPRGNDVALLIEAADATLMRDRGLKKHIYAKAGIPQYWIINLVDRQIEVFLDPDPAAGDYRQPTIYGMREEITVAIDGIVIGTLRLEELLPRE